MGFLKKYKIAVGVLILAVLLFTGYQYFDIAEEIPLLTLSGPSAIDGSIVGREIVRQIDELLNLNLQKEGVFREGLIESLVDYHTPIRLEPVGRNNPFVPIGTDGVFTGTPVDTSYINQ